MTSSLHALLQDAVAQHQAGELDRAEALYRQCLTQAPDDPDVLNFLGTLLGQRGQLEDGEALIRQAIEVQPAHAPAWNNLGSVLRQAQRSVKAEQAFRRALELEPQVVTLAGQLIGGQLLDPKRVGAGNQLAECRQGSALRVASRPSSAMASTPNTKPPMCAHHATPAMRASGAVPSQTWSPNHSSR